MRYLITLFIFIFITRSYSHVCSIDTGLIGTWKSSYYGTITITPTTITLGKHTFVVNTKTTNTMFECHFSSSLTYVMKSVDTMLTLGETGHLYVCLAFTRLNDNSYYFYMNSPTNHIFGNDRVVFWSETAAAPSFSNICSETSPVADFTTIVKDGSEQNAKINCMSTLFHNFYYDRTTSTGATSNCRTSGSNPLNVCDDKQTMKFNTTECSTPVLFSKNGNLACVVVIQSGSTYYASLYNEDPESDINGLTTFQFTCIASSVSSTGEIELTAQPNRCDETQTTSTRPTNGEILVLTSYYSCAIVEEDDSSSVVGLAVGLTLLFIIIIIIIVVIIWYFMKRRKRQKLQNEIKYNISSFKRKLKVRDADDKHPLSETSLGSESYPKEISKHKKRTPSSVGEVFFPTHSKGGQNRGNKSKYPTDDKSSVRRSADTLQADLYMQRTSTSLDVLPSRKQTRAGRYGRSLKHEQSLPDLAEYTTPTNSRPPSRLSGVYDASATSTRMFKLRKSMSLETMQRRTKDEYPTIKHFQSDSKVNESHQKYFNYPIQKRKTSRNSNVTKVAKTSVLGHTHEALKTHKTTEQKGKKLKPYVTLPRYFRPQRQDSFEEPFFHKGPERPTIVNNHLNKFNESMLQRKYPVNIRRTLSRKEISQKKKNLWKSPYILTPKVSGFFRMKKSKFIKAPKIKPYEFNFNNKDTYESRRFATSDYEIMNESDDEDVFIEDRARYPHNTHYSFNRHQRDLHLKRSRKLPNEDSGVSAGDSISSEDAKYPIPDIMTGF